MVTESEELKSDVDEESGEVEESASSGSELEEDTEEPSSFDSEDTEEDVSSGDSGTQENISSGDAFEGDVSDNSSPGSVDKPSVSSGDIPRQVVLEQLSESNPELAILIQDLYTVEYQKMELLSDIEEQNSAVISILLIFMVVGLLHYLYRFFKIFF